MIHFQTSLAAGTEDMFDVYLKSVPVLLNNMAVAFGEVFFLEAFKRRIAHCKCVATKTVFEKLGLLYSVWNIVEKAGDYRDGNIFSSDQLTQLKDRVLTLLPDLINEAIPLSKMSGIYYYNIFGHEDFYEKFLSTLAQAKGSFDKIPNWQDCLMPVKEDPKK